MTDHSNPDNTPSDAELAEIVGSNMQVVPRLEMTDEDARAMTHDAHKAVTDLARLMARAAEHLGAGDADEVVTLGYDHTARSVYAEVNLMGLMEVVMHHMNGPNLKRNDICNGAATPMVRATDSGSAAIRLFLQGK